MGTGDIRLADIPFPQITISFVNAAIGSQDQVPDQCLSPQSVTLAITLFFISLGTLTCNRGWVGAASGHGWVSRCGVGFKLIQADGV